MSAFLHSADKENDQVIEGKNRQYPYSQDVTINLAAKHKRKFIGGGTLQSLSKYLDHYFERRRMESIGPRFVYGMQHAEEFPLPPLGRQDLTPMPTSSEKKSYLHAYFTRIHPMYPILDQTSFCATIEQLTTKDFAALRQEEVPLLASAYCVFALGADESAGHCTTIGYIYLTSEFKLWAYIVSVPYLTSVQALLLLTITLKSRNKDGCGAQSLGQAIRIAQSLGLNHGSIKETTTVHGERSLVDDSTDVAACCWWVCYCLEQMFGLEIGRPTLIKESDCYQALPQAMYRTTNFFRNWTALCQIQNRLYEAVYARPEHLRNATALLQDIGSIDRGLCDWAAAVEPEEIRSLLTSYLGRRSTTLIFAGPHWISYVVLKTYISQHFWQ